MRRPRQPVRLGIVNALIEADAAHRHAEFAGDLLRPSGEIQRRAVEFWSIEVAHAGIEYIDAGFRQGAQDFLQFLRGAGQPRAKILLFPLRKAKYDGPRRTNRGADGFDDFRRESGAPDAITAPAIVAPTGLLPEEIIRHIAVRTMHGDAVET